MKKLNKALSVLLTFVMLFTTFCFFPLDLGTIEADAAVPGIKIVVPETIYLTPSTGASTKGQHYVNNNSDGSVKTAYDTAASVAVTYPGATLISVSATNADIGAITGLNGTSLGSSAATASGAVTLNSGINAGSTALIEWVFVFEKDGKTQTHYAYSVAYAPWYQPVGAAAKAVGSYANVFSSSILWVSGVHGYSTGDSKNLKYVQTANFLPMLGALTTPSNNNPETNWIQDESSGLGATISYQSISESGLNYHSRANSISPTANITVDISRYNNFNQIPNFKVGFMITDHENAEEGSWYVSDYGTSSGSSYYNGTAQGGSRYDGDYNDTGTIISGWSNSADYSCGIKVNQQSWNKGVTGTASFRIKSAVYGYKKYLGIKCTSWNNNFVNISVTGANKSALRTAVLNGTTYAKENYTADTWNTYYSALKTAATNLGNPVSATVDTSALTNAEAGLHTTVYFDANGGALGGSTPASLALQIGSANTLSYNNADIVGSFNATRTGYTFLGWSTEKGATTAPASFTIGFNDTLYAVWQANKYQVVFDNRVDYSAWNKAAGNGTVSDITDNGFTITSNDGAGESTCESPYFPVTPGKKYKVHMDITGTDWDVYIFFCDANGTWVDFKDGPSNRYSTGGSTGVDPDNAIFTAPDKAEVVKAKIRVDANGSNNTVRFENIRVFEVDNENADISYEAPIMVTYDQPFGTLPTPTRTGYEFQGWVDENGTPYASTTKVAITETLRLYSTWEIGTYTITFDSDGGSAVAPITQQYDTPVTAPAAPTKTGYTFAGWENLPEKMPGKNTTVKAKWDINYYEVQFEDFDGRVIDTQQVPYLGSATAPADPTREGYTFKNWDKSFNSITGDITVTAQYEINYYTVKFVDFDGSVIDTQQVPYLGSATAPEDPTREGYTFKNWDKSFNSITGDVTVTAQYEINYYEVQFVDYDGRVIATQQVPYLGSATAPKDPTREGYTFKNWDKAFDEITEKTTITAVYNINQYTVTYELDNGEENIVQTYDYNADVTAPADPTKTGYEFEGWDADIPAKMPAYDVTIKANWTVKQYTITFDTDGGSEIAPETYDFGASITAPAAPTKTGYDFVGWAPALPGTMPAENLEVKALWEIKKFTVTFKFFDNDGTEIAVTRENIEYGTDFSELTLPTAAEGLVGTYYNGAVTDYKENTHHYVFNNKWANEVEKITADVTFTAQYDAVVHDYNRDIEASKAATCTETGIKAEYCDCGYRYEDEITALGHDWKETDRKEYCTKEGSIFYKCQRANCTIPGGATKEDKLDPTGHSFSNVTPKQAPTCTEIGYEAYMTCEVCNLYFAENADVMAEGVKEKTEIPATGHDYVGEQTKAPSCLEKGEMTYTCKNDNSHTYKEAVDALGHTFGAVEARVAPGCETDGHEAYKKCETCEKFFSANAENNATEFKDSADGFKLNRKGHSYDEVVVTPPTCTEGGYTTYTCSACGDSYTDNFTEATGHKNAAPVVENDKPASCTEDGSYDEVVYCSVCDAVISRTTKVHEALGHTEEIRQENIKDATCTDPGSYDNVPRCKVCGVQTGKAETVNGATLPHDFSEEIVDIAHQMKAATCYSLAVYYYDCKNCDTKASEADDTFTYGTKLDHTPADKAETEDYVDSTCYQEGSYNAVVYCSVCEAAGIKTVCSTTEETVAKKAHTAGEVVIENNVAPTCYATGSYDKVTYCTVCEAAGQDKVQTSRETVTVGMVDHTPAEAVKENIVAPKCEENGSYDLVVYCSVCADAGKTFVISKTPTTVPMTGHKDGEAKVEDNIPATCTVNGSYNLVVRCTVCNEITSSEAKVIVALGHTDGEAKVEDNVPATCTEDGSYNLVVRCTVCNEITSSEPKVNVALGHTEAEAVIENEVAVKCESEGSYETVVYCSVCDQEISRDKTVIPATGHTEGTVVYENVVPATETANGSRDEVVYCVTCNEELSRVTVVLKPVRVITYVLHGETIKVEAHTGDTLTPPEVAPYTDANGFTHQFKKWDKPLAVVSGAATYTAIYTQPCDYSELDAIKETLDEILAGGVVEDAVLEENKAEIERVLGLIEDINAKRNTRDESEQNVVDFVTGEIGGVIDVIYPDIGSTLVIEGSSVAYVGTILDLKAVKMPLGATLTDATWVSSDDNVVFFSNGKLYAIGTGTVTLTATRGILKASKVVTVIEGGNTRGINFTSINNTHFIIEDYAAVYNSAIIYWSDDYDLRFRVRVYQSFMFEDYIVYINGVEVEPDENGYYVVPAGSGDARVTIAGAVIDTGAGEGDTVTKWSFWEWLLNLFRKIINFFKDIFGMA